MLEFPIWMVTSEFVSEMQVLAVVHFCGEKVLRVENMRIIMVVPCYSVSLDLCIMFI